MDQREFSIRMLLELGRSILERAQEQAADSRYEDAEKSAASAVDTLQKTYDLDKKNQSVKWDLAIAYRLCALYKMINGRHRDARPLNQLAFSAFNELNQEQPSDDTLFNLGLQAEQTGDNLADLQDNGAAGAMYAVALYARKNHLMNNDTPKNKEAVDRILRKQAKAGAQPQKIDVNELHDLFDFNYEEGDREFEGGRFRDAAESYASAVKAGLAIVQHQGGVKNMRNAVMACKKAADTLMKLRKFGDAADYYGQMEELAHRALSLESDSTDLYLANLAQAGTGAAYAAWGRTADARKKYGDALQSAQALAGINPSQFKNLPGEFTAILGKLR